MIIDLDKIDNEVKILNNNIDDVNEYRVKGQKINKKLINQFIDHIQKDPLLRDYIVNLFFNVGFNKSEESK